MGSLRAGSSEGKDSGNLVHFTLSIITLLLILSEKPAAWCHDPDWPNARSDGRALLPGRCLCFQSECYRSDPTVHRIVDIP